MVMLNSISGLMLHSDHYELGSVLTQVTATITLLIAPCI